MKIKVLVTILLINILLPVFGDENQEVFSIIENYSSIMKDDNNNWTVAHCVAAYGTATEMEILLEAADLMDAQDDFGNTPVMIAALYSNIDVFRTLIKNGCNLKVFNSRGGSCCTYLGYFNDEDQDEVLALFDDVGNIDRPTSRGMSLLHYSVHGGQKTLTGKLLNYKVDVNREETTTHMRPIDMARFITFQYTDYIEIGEDDVTLENEIVDLLIDNGSRYKSYIPMSIAVFGNFFFNIYIAIDSILENGISLDEVNLPDYYSYVVVNGSENPIITLEAVERMFGDVGIEVELEVHNSNFEEVIDDCNYSEDLYVILANLSDHPYLKNHWALVSTRYRSGSYQNFLKAFESSSLFEPMFYRLDDIGTMISIKVNR
jgi:ankyrin repeat protein